MGYLSGEIDADEFSAQIVSKTVTMVSAKVGKLVGSAIMPVGGAVVGSMIASAVSAYIIDGLTKDSIKQLKKYAKDGCCQDGNLVEVMCCEGGCIGGNSNIANPKIAKKIINSLLEKSNDLK